MTRPDELLKAIGWGEELLEAIWNDAEVPEDLRTEAQQLAQSYPHNAELLKHVRGNTGTDVFPLEAGISLERARLLFEAVQQGGVGSARTRSDVLFTLRHFPSGRWAQLAVKAARAGRLELLFDALPEDSDPDGMSQKDRERTQR